MWKDLFILILVVQSVCDELLLLDVMLYTRDTFSFLRLIQQPGFCALWILSQNKYFKIILFRRKCW